ncbi:MAG TPA: outer membrane beta-barrel protein [Puia sp.]|jgi:opacity protein-like surface antigen|nr:outer membrane beta-barrel protein [Puia sp.]
MSKLILILSLGILFITNLHAQNSGWSINAGVGLAFPSGKFGSKNIHDSTASFAKTGPAFNLGVDYKLKKNFGLSFLISGQQNNVDTKTLDNKLEAAFPGNEFHSTSNNWFTWEFMAGAYISLPLDKKNKINFTARAMAGILKTSTYKFSQSQRTDPNDTLNLGGGTTTIESFGSYQQPVKSTFTYLAGVGLQYNLDKIISFKTNIDYSAASLSFGRIGYASSSGASLATGTVTGPGGINQTTRSYPKQPFASINWRIGIGINL